MSGTYFEDQHGNEHVTFSDREWEIMLSDPAFGYICAARKHRMTEGDHRYGACMSCEAEAERAEDAWNDYPADEDADAFLERFDYPESRYPRTNEQAADDMFGRSIF